MSALYAHSREIELLCDGHQYGHRGWTQWVDMVPEDDGILGILCTPFPLIVAILYVSTSV